MSELQHRIRDSLLHSLEIAEHLVVPKAQHPLPVLGQEISSRLVTDIFSVLAAIDFDNQPSFEREEIDEEWAD